MEISIESPASKFTDHLALEQNSRILFSGGFGTGKSHFLRKYLGDKKDKYNLFWISPIHYVVGANADIFEWIKLDIARQLIMMLPQEKKENIPDNFLLQAFAYQNTASIFTRLLSTAIGKLINSKTGVDPVATLIEDYNKYKNKVESSFDSHFEQLKDFIEGSLTAKGSIYEDDLTTQILRANLEQIKESSKKESILVIDDLDRLDPEHVFRILNILSAHNDHFDTNKYGFDKVTVVCDLKNIRHMYEYRYGPEVDFDGYIEKFYTFEPFYFTLDHAIISYCTEQPLFHALDQNSQRVLAIFLRLFLTHKKLKIRNLAKIASYHGGFEELNLNDRIYSAPYPTPIRPYHTRIIDTTNFTVNVRGYDSIRALYLLALAFGGIKNLQKAMNSFTGSREPFQVEDLLTVINALALISHIAKGVIRQKQETFYNWQTYGEGNNNIAIDYPMFQFLANQGCLQLKWGELPGQRYTENDGDYFENANYSTIFHGLQSAESRIAACTIGNLIADTLPIIDFMVSESIVTNIEP